MHTQPRLSKTHRDGQALIEFIVGLVAILALTAGLLQLTTLANAQRDTLSDARQEAGQHAFLLTGPLEAPRYIETWSPGPDDRTFSRDDVARETSQLPFQRQVVDRLGSSPADWTVMDTIPDNPMADLRTTPEPVDAFGLVVGSAHRNVTLLPAVRHLLFSADAIDVESKVWMTECSNFY